MEIIKEGKFYIRKFTCKYCECIFASDIGEYKLLLDDQSVAVKCPWCSNLLKVNTDDAPLIEKLPSRIEEWLL